jgi:short-subunit dehydrogenase
MTSTQAPLALITGVGPGTGSSLARRFAAGGYRLTMLARDAARLQALEAELAGSRAWVCDVGVEADLRATVDAVVSAQGAPRVIVHNAVGGSFGNFNDIDPAVLTRNFEINTVALLHLARLLTPAMVAAGDGAIIVTGNTSALRGKPLFAGFAPTKAAQRILA